MLVLRAYRGKEGAQFLLRINFSDLRSVGGVTSLGKNIENLEGPFSSTCMTFQHWFDVERISHVVWSLSSDEPMNEPLVAHVNMLGRFVQEAELGSLAGNSPVWLLLAAGIPAAPWHASKLSSVLP